jgi:hypothetical protein
MFDPKWFEKNQVKKYLPVVPEDMVQAYDFGYILKTIDVA